MKNKSKGSQSHQHSKSATRLVLDAIHRAFTAPEHSYDVIAPDLLIGVSGGVDSVVLAHALITKPPATAKRIAIAHFDHALRPDSAKDADFVRGLASQWGVPIFEERWQRPALGEKSEEAARAARYAFLMNTVWGMSEGQRSGMVALGHHLDDLAETVLMHIVRGSGTEGISAMREFSKAPFDWRTTIARPLLRLHQQVLRQYAKENLLQWREDPTNTDLRYTRNYVRHIIIPALKSMNPSVEEALAKLSRAAWNDRLRLKRFEPHLDSYTAEHEYDVRVLMPLSENLYRYWAWDDWIGRMRAALRATFGYRHTAGIDDLDAIALKVSAKPQVTGPHPLGAGISWSVIQYTPFKREPTLALSFHDSKALAWDPWGPWFAPKTQKMLPFALKIPGVNALPNDWKLTIKVVPASKFNPKRSDPQTGWLDASKAQSLAVTTAKAGMRMAPLGMGGSTRTLGDIFTDRKILPALRSQWPVVIDAQSGEVLWLCWLVTSEHAKITDDSTRALHMRWKGPERPEFRLVGEYF